MGTPQPKSQASTTGENAAADRIRLSPDDATALDLPPVLHEWLSTTGLPVLDGETLGVTFQKRRVAGHFQGCGPGCVETQHLLAADHLPVARRADLTAG